MLPKPGTPLPDSLVNRVARSYTPSEKAQALFEDKIEVRFADVVELACERLIGRNLSRIDYRQ